MIIYEVQQGDSLYRIAQRYDVPVQYLVELNQISMQRRLVPGQIIILPEVAIKHVVQKGDTLESIAEQYGTTKMSLWQMNPALGGEEDIYLGQNLAISYKNPPEREIVVNGYVYPYVDVPSLRKVLPYLTYLSVFSYQFDISGKLTMQNVKPVINLAKEYYVKPLMVLTAMDEEGRFSTEAVHDILTVIDIRDTLFESVLQALRSAGYEGVDIDFEYVAAEDRDLFTEFVQELKDFLAPFGYEVFIALVPKASATQAGLLYEGHDYRALGAAADQVLLMTYE